MIKNKIKRVSPVWLASTWESRKKETVKCVEAAIERLRETDRYVTLTSIRDEVRLLFGRSLSTNTIKRNECAYQLYLGGRRAPKARQAKSHLILELYAQVEPKKKAAIQATVARLRRQAKDDLIARIMRIEEELTEQMNVANRLREKIILADAAQHRNKLPSNEGDMMQVEQMEREFTYNGVRLPDPGHKLSVDQVRDTYAAAYPEIATASLEGPEAVGNKLVYRFSRAIGSKG